MATSIDAYLAANGLPQSYGTPPASDPYSFGSAPAAPSYAAPSPYDQGYSQGQQQAAPAAPVNALASAPSPDMSGMSFSGPPQALVDAAIQANRKGHGFLDTVGRIGDVLAAFGGKDGVYMPWRQQQQLRKAFADWQANPDDQQAQANFLAAAPADAFSFMQQRRANQFGALKAGLDIQQAMRTNAQAAVGRAATILKGVRDAGGDIGAAYDNLRATGQLDAVGMHPGEHDYYRDLVVKTPGVLDQLAAAPDAVIVPGGEGAPSTLVNKATGGTIATGTPGNVKLAPGEGLFPTGGGQPVSNDPTAPAPATAPVGGQPAIVAGNNHGALKDGAFAQAQPGYTGRGANGFATFATPGAGIVAQEKLLRTAYLGKGVNTVSDIVDKYAPPGPENSDASRAAYKSYVASQLGVDPNTPISGQQLRPLAAAMRNFETGQGSGGAPVTAPGGITRGATAPTPPGAIAYNAGGDLTEDAKKQAAEQWILTGQIPQGLGRGGMAQKQILDTAAALGYSPGQISAIRARNAADSASLGTLENNATLVRSAEGAAEKNADLALSLAPKVGNGNIPLFNAWKNAAQEHRGQGPIAGLNTALTTFVNQYATVMGKGTPTEGLRHEGQELINSAQSPDQLGTVVKTMRADMANMKQSYEDERRSTSTRLAGGLPKPVATPQEAAALPKGTRFITPDGRFGTR